MENIISVKDMTFEYVSIDSKFRAIDNLNLEVKQGEFVAIIGHNGSGKSTLSKNLNAILVPTEGDIYIDGMNTKDEAITSPPKRRCFPVPVMMRVPRTKSRTEPLHGRRGPASPQAIIPPQVASSP